MKFLLKTLIVAVIILAIIFSLLYIFVVFKGKALVIEGLARLTDKKISLDYVELDIPFVFRINKLKIEGIVEIESVHIVPSIIGLLSGNLAFNEIKIIKPEFTFERFTEPEAQAVKTEAASASAPMPAPEQAPLPKPEPQALVKQQEKKPLRPIIKNFNVRDGRINFIDHSVGKDGIKIIVKDINLSLNNLYLFPRSAISRFELSGRIPWFEGNEHEGGKIKAEGWFNLFKKDIQAELEITGIDGVYLYPYYSAWANLDQARIDKAKLSFTSNIHGLNNNVTAECRIELTDIVRKPRSPDQPQEKAEKIADAILDIFRGINQGRIVLDFTLRTKMDRPEFSFSDIRMAFEDTLTKARGTRLKPEDVVAFPGRLLQGVFKSITDLSKAVIDGTFAVGNEIKKAAEETFRREE